MISEQEITCISCPVGCRIQVKLADDLVESITGNACKRGELYARQECLSPQRMVTAVALVKGSRVPVSMKTEKPIPKQKIPACMDEINSLQLKLPIMSGDVLKEDVAGTGVRLVATRSLV